MGEGDVELQIAVQYIKLGQMRYETLGTAGSVNSKYKSYSLMSADETIVMLGEPSGNRVRLVANQLGSTNIMVYGVKADGAKDIVGVIPVQVSAQAMSSMMSCTMNKSTLDLDNPDDFIKLYVNVSDQYGRTMYGENVRIVGEALGAPYSRSGMPFTATGEYTI